MILTFQRDCKRLCLELPSAVFSQNNTILVQTAKLYVTCYIGGFLQTPVLNKARTYLTTHV